MEISYLTHNFRPKKMEIVKNYYYSINILKDLVYFPFSHQKLNFALLRISLSLLVPLSPLLVSGMQSESEHQRGRAERNLSKGLDPVV